MPNCKIRDKALSFENLLKKANFSCQLPPVS